MAADEDMADIKPTPTLDRLLNPCNKLQRSKRRKVEVETTDACGRPLPQADIRLMKRYANMKKDIRPGRQAGLLQGLRCYVTLATG